MIDRWDTETGVLVIGGGGCGFAAAIAAHDAGAEVAVVEKLARVGGNTALSTGSIPGAGSRFQRAAGIDDSPDRMYHDLSALAGPHDCPDLTRLLADQSAELVEWLVDTVGARMALITDYRHVGHSVARLHAPRSRRGQDLLDDLTAAVAARDIPVAVGNGAESLVTDRRGAVTGAVVGDAQGRRSRIGAAKIVLATNGYAANKELVRRFCPEIGNAAYFGALGSTGEAVIWGENLGAELANMAAYQGYAAVAYPHGSLLTWTTIEKGGILINRAARRFGDEAGGYSGFAREVIAEGGTAFAVFDQRIRAVAALEEEFTELARMGGVKSAASLADLAAIHDLDRAALTATIDAYNGAAAGAAADPFGRRAFGLAPLVPPFQICRVQPGLFHTQGGLKVDDGARVLHRDGGVIANLFAGGGAAAGISGRAGGYGYASGAGLLSALGLGRLAGRTAAHEIGAGV